MSRAHNKKTSSIIFILFHKAVRALLSTRPLMYIKIYWNTMLRAEIPTVTIEIFDAGTV